MHQVVVKPDGFQWDGKTCKRLSKVASAIAGSLERSTLLPISR